MELHSRFVAYLTEKFPNLKGAIEKSPDLIADHLLSPFEIRLPKQLLEEINQAIQAVHEVRNLLADKKTSQSPINPGNFSTMMSLDFHLDETDQLKLIEINTNAAFLLMSWEMYQFRGIPYPATSFSPDQWKADLTAEMELNQNKSLLTGDIPRITIADERPSDQKLFIEFLLGQEWIKSWGWTVDIRDIKDALQEPRPDLIYNRSTDFFLKDPNLKNLRIAYENRAVCLSPNPHEYSLLADKQRLIEWSTPGYLEDLKVSQKSQEILRKILLQTFDVSKLNPEELWSQRKHFFLKPKREFGSKKAFRGASISRKLFDEMMNEDMLAQEFVPPQERTFPTPEGELKLKFDLRCHFYQDRLESVIARLYQGQVTNLKTPYGGFTPVVFE